jgi:hypothetical protein
MCIVKVVGGAHDKPVKALILRTSPTLFQVPIEALSFCEKMNVK